MCLACLLAPVAASKVAAQAHLPHPAHLLGTRWPVPAARHGGSFLPSEEPPQLFTMDSFKVVNF